MAELFVYGTLLFPEIISALTGKDFVFKNAILYKYKRCKVITEGAHTSYPAVVESDSSFVEGRLLFDVDEKTLNLLDFFEGEEYVRKTLTVFSDKKLIPAFVYVWRSDKKSLGNLWNYDDFKQKEREYYLKTIIPNVLKEYNLKSD